MQKNFHMHPLFLYSHNTNTLDSKNFMSVKVCISKCPHHSGSSSVENIETAKGYYTQHTGECQ